MTNVTAGMRFEVSHKAATPEDPGLVGADDIAAYMQIDSAAISSATSKAVSTVLGASPNSTGISTADSKGVSAGGAASVADSKAVSESGTTSIADSKALSVSVNTSVADSKGTSAGTASVSATNPPRGGRTVGTIGEYLNNNAVVNVKDFGALGNGVADDTAAIQLTLNYFSGTGWNGSAWGNPTKSGTVYFPEGTYLISSTLTYYGGSAFSVIIAGVAGAGQGTSGATLKWNGAPSGTMFYAQGMCRSTMRDLTFDGAQSSHHVLYCIQVDGKNTTQSGSPGSQADTFERVMCRIGTVANSAGFAFGHAASNDQVDTIVVRDCFVQGQGATTTTGILILAGGNVTHFSVLGGTYTTLGYVLQAPNITGLAVRDTICLLTTAADFNLTGAPLQAVFSHVHSEQAVNAQFVAVLAAGGPAAVHLDACSWSGVAPANDVIVAAGTSTVLVTGGDYANTRTGSSVPKFQIGNPRNGPTGANLGGLHSRGAYYANADNTAAAWPFADFGGNILAVSLPGVAGTYYDLFAMGASFSSVGDFGGTTRGAMLPLKAQDSVASARNFTKLRSASNDALTDVAADATIGLKHGDAIKFKVETGAYADADINGLSKNASDVVVVGGPNGASMTTGIITGALKHQGTTAGLYNVTPVVRAAAITTPTAPSAGYVQAEAASMKTAVDAIRVALQNLGVTL